MSLAVTNAGLAVVCCALSPQGGQPAAWYFQSNVPVRSYSVDVWMWRASFSWSSLGLLARSITLVSCHLMGWWCFQACSATADFSSIPLQQASWCSSFLSQASWSSPQCRSSHSCRGSGKQPWTASLLAVCP